MNRQRLRKTIILLSFLLFPITLFYFSPYLPIEGAFYGIVVGSVVIFMCQFVLSLFFGRAFCGWLCPAASLQEHCAAIVKKQNKRNRRDLIKFYLWMPWVALVIAFFVVAGGAQRIDIFFQTKNGISVAEPGNYIVYFLVISLIVITSFVAGRRGFCHYICWMAPFMIIARSLKNIIRFPALSLSVDNKKCINCKVCNAKCQMCLDVNSMVQKGRMEDQECILCGECVDACPKKVIVYSFS